MRKFFCASVFLAVFSCAFVRADSVTLGFPSSSSTTFRSFDGANLPLGHTGVHFQAGDYVTQTFTATGLASTTTSRWVFDMADFTFAGSINTFDISINNTLVGSFSFIGTSPDRSNPTETDRHFDLTFNHAAIAGDTYALKMTATSNVPPGNASWNWLDGGQVTLANAEAAAAPLPTSVWSGTVLLSAFSLMRRRTIDNSLSII